MSVRSILPHRSVNILPVGEGMSRPISFEPRGGYIASCSHCGKKVTGTDILNAAQHLAGEPCIEGDIPFSLDPQN